MLITESSIRKMKMSKNNTLNLSLLTVLLFFVHNSTSAQCEIKRETNSSFEESKVIFFDSGSGETTKSIDLQKSNPYNNLPFKFKSIDPDYGMYAYELTSGESDAYTEQILGVLSQDTIAYLNSQVDVVIDKDCNAIVSYGLYRMSKEGEYLSFASTIQIYDQRGDLMSEIADNNHLLTTPVFTKGYTYLMVGAVKSSDLESIRLVDLTTKRTILELDRCDGEVWGNPAKIQDSDLLVALLISGDNSYDDRTYYVFDPQKKVVSYLRINKEETRNIVGLYPNGMVIGQSKEKRQTLSYNGPLQIGSKSS